MKTSGNIEAMAHSDHPYKNLGQSLKLLRGKVSESLPEVSGALEIDVETLVRIEKGVIRPSEETLLLLVSHFGVRDDEATKLWAMAGYKPSKVSMTNNTSDEPDSQKSMVMVMADPRIVYTDSLHVVVNNFGVVMNFMQNSGLSSQPMAVARIGMSKEHAKSVLELLNKTLQESTSEPVTKQLPAPKNQNNNRKKF